MNLTGFQFLAITVFLVLQSLDGGGPQTQFFSRPTVIGFVLGSLLGDVKLGLFIGGTLEFMSMGVFGLGGASVPNYSVTTAIATIIACTTDGGYELGMAVAIPVGTLYTNLDVLKKTINGFIYHWSRDLCNKGDFKGMLRVPYLCILLTVVMNVGPVLIMMIAGQAVVQAIVGYLPKWLTQGMSVAGTMLPAAGMAMLLSFMPAGKHITYLLLGFVMFAYLKVDLLGIALAAVGLGIKYYKDEMWKIKIQQEGGGALADE